VWKRQPAQIAAARVVLRHAGPGDVVLARDRLSQTLAVMSAKVTTIAPRLFVVRALRGVPAVHEPERELLRRLVLPDRSPPAALTRRELRRVRRALHATRVDIACAPPANLAARRALVRAGFGRPFRAQHLTCLRAPEHLRAAADLGFRPAAGRTRG
jgi:hypothetical protein